jgi:type I restriction-modification system DNA methylase subunit
VLDSLIVDDSILKDDLLKLSKYDFNTDVDVNILGHIFEHSLSEIEEVEAELKGEVADKAKGKRKKDGVFYTPKYITKYIVENTIGKLCSDKKTELKLDVDVNIFEYQKADIKLNTKGIELYETLNQYKAWLLTLKILDPACGSGAFLNQAVNFLIQEHQFIDDIISELTNTPLRLYDTDIAILENNIYGVDINEESVEIAKLSLWLRTARQGRKLSNLSNNIKCGNSLIDDPAVAGDKAFNWQKEFPEVFAKGGFDVVIGNPPYGAYIDKISKDFYQKKWQTFQGNFEIYFFFIELVSYLIKPFGKIGFITPDTWISIPQAKKLREHVLRDYGINNIVVFKNPVFEDASLNAIVFILSFKNRNDICEIVNFDSETGSFSNKTNISKLGYIDNWRNSEDKQFQVLQNEFDFQIINKLNSKSIAAKNYLDVCQGIVPYSTENLSKDDVKNRVYHSTQPIDDNYGIWIQGRSINRYSLNIFKEEYLNYGNWLHRPRKIKYFYEDRILVQEITGGCPPRISAINFYGKLFHDPGIISCINFSSLNTKYLLALINSKLLSWYTFMTSPKGNRLTFPKILIGDIRKLPIIETTNENQNEIIKNVERILELNKEFSEEIQKFHRSLSRKFALAEYPKKLQVWYMLSYGEFIKELGKKKIKLSLSDEAEWETYFTTEAQKTLELKSNIEKTDKEIDQMVYALYELTEDEIKIVEESRA